MRLRSLVLGAGLSVVAAWPCCGVTTGPVVRFGDQMNVVVWDSGHGMEHFVRQARFDASTPDFGFLAPSPSVPQLADAKKEVFERLARLKPHPASVGCAKAEFYAKSADAAADVQVVREQDVAGYHAVTLKATDATGLSKWLGNHSYKTSAQVDQWLKVYVDKGWYITAFLIKVPGGSVQTGLVRMSFKTDAPFNPYFVPAESLVGASKTHIYFVTDGDATISVGAHGPDQGYVWNATVPDETLKSVAEDLKLPADSMPSAARVTYFELPFDAAVKDDLFLHRNSHLPEAVTPIGIGVGFIALIVLIRRLRK